MKYKKQLFSITYIIVIDNVNKHLNLKDPML